MAKTKSEMNKACYDKNYDKIYERFIQPACCPICDCSVLYVHMSRHRKTKKH